MLDADVQALARELAKVGSRVEAVGRREARQHRLVLGAALARAHLGDLERAAQCLGQIPEQRDHLLGALEVELLRAVMAALHLLHRHAGGDALQHHLSVRVLLFEVVAIVGRHHRQAELAGERDEHLVERLLLDEAVVLQLDEERARLEDVAQRAHRLTAGLLTVEQHLLRDVPTHARAGPKPLGFRELLEVDARRLREASTQPRLTSRIRFL